MGVNNNKSGIPIQYYKSFFEILPNPAYVWEKTNEVLILKDYNKAAEKITNGKVLDYLGILASDLYKDEPDILKELENCANNKEHLSKEMAYEFKSTGRKSFFIVDYVYVPPNFVLVYTKEISKEKIFEEELKESEDKYRNLFRTSRDGIALVDLEGNIIDCNEAYYNMINYTEAETLKMNYHQFTPDKWRELDSRMDIQALERGYSDEFEKEYIKKNGTEIPISIRLWAQKDQKGNTTGIWGLVRDITAQKEAEVRLKKSEEQYRLIINNIKDYIAEFNPDGTLVYVNPAVYGILGYKPEELIGRKQLSLLHPEDLKRVVEAMNDRLKLGDLKNIDYRLLHKNGHYVPVSSNASIVEIFDKKRVIISVRDVTEWIKAQQNVKESEEKYRVAYFRVNLYKDIFSHDINNIFQNILTSVELCKTCIRDHNWIEKFVKISQIISEQVIRGKILVENVQKLAQIEGVQSPLRKINISESIKSAIKLLKLEYPYKNIQIETESLESNYYVYANKYLIDVFKNILYNSVNHNINPIIEISIKTSTVRERDKNKIRIEFIDNGVGIPAKMKDEIFLREPIIYENGKTASGTGLGLLLAKRILHIFNGSIYVKDRIHGDYSKGCIFEMELPRVDSIG